MRDVTRIHLPGPLASGDTRVLPDAAARHVSRVLRLREDDEIVVFDGAAGEHDARLHEVSSRRVVVVIGEYRAGSRASPLTIELVQGVARGQRMDYTIQKATELGASRIRPVLAERTVVKLDEARAAARHAHWQGVAVSACEQCGLNRVPEVCPIESLASWLARPAEFDEQRVVLSTRATHGIGALPRPPGRLALLIGPEGGLTPRETTDAIAAGCEPVRLGPRILRTETAAPAALAIFQARWGDLDC